MFPLTVPDKIEATRCPIRSVLAKMTGKWQILILFALEDGALRFGQVKRTLGDITQRVLTENLRSLERDGLVSRTVEPGPPVAVYYELTDLGTSFVETYRPVILWANEHLDEVKTTRDDYDTAHAGD
ncbi:MAG: helix-turn-helix domain-containing protein [Actinomycetota bacterium]